MNNKISKYVQYGCGFDAPETWLNFDSSPTLRFERLPLIGNLYTKNKIRFPKHIKYGNIVTGLPISKDTCDGIYCSHVLEHLSLENFRKALNNTYAYLKPEGIFRLVVPDLFHIVKEYQHQYSRHNKNASMNFIKSSGLGIEQEAVGIRGIIYEAIRGSRHKWMWDYYSLRDALDKAGFIQIRKCKFNDCPDKHFKEVERAERFGKALALECKKPK